MELKEKVEHFYNFNEIYSEISEIQHAKPWLREADV